MIYLLIFHFFDLFVMFLRLFVLIVDDLFRLIGLFFRLVFFKSVNVLDWFVLVGLLLFAAWTKLP